MINDDYLKAQKLGMKAYKASVSQGKFPYLPVLDEILSLANIDYEKPLGVSDIPLNQVVGTSTFGRTQAFASNFMPLLEISSEFAGKWASLLKSQEEEGIRDAVKVYEYMNKYYVVEGNKRVSVMKYLDCPTILADVTRKVPKRSDDLENRIYFEYIDFYELTKINYIQFSKTGRYDKLLTATGKNTEETWTVEERQHFASFYAAFEKAFKEKGGQQLANVTNGDALLLYLTFYPYEESKDAGFGEIRENLEKIWSEVVLFGEENSIELSMDPAAEKTTVGSVINKIRILPQKKKKVAFVYDKQPEKSDWIYGHELGRLRLKEVLGDTIDIQVYMTDTMNDNSEEVLETVCQEGCDIIFAVSPKMIKACLKAAVAYPDVIILNCALNSSYNTVRTYYTRMYEAKFLTGMIAGSMTPNGKVGYVADYPLYGAAASINAFALGAKMVNPHAKIYLAWSTLKDINVDQYFKSQEVCYISDQDMITPHEDMKRFGLYQETDSGKVNLAMPVYDWGVFYEKLINSILRGSWKAEESVENKAINYWWGLSSGVIDIICSKKLPAGTRKMIELMKKGISSGLFHPFTGPMIQQDGTVHYKEDEVMKPEDIMRMDWLVDNVIGSIPTIDELKEEAQPVVKLRGLYSTTADKGGNSLP